jgi:hypothetical protein
MPVREFADRRGVEWRVWEVRPESIYPRTKEEDFLASMYVTGWLVFVTKKEDDKRRLYPVPTGWSDLPVAELELLLQKAQVIKSKLDKKSKGGATAQAMDRASEFAERAADRPEPSSESARKETPDVTDLEVQRVFRYPGGRLWAVAMLDSQSGRHPILRFMTGRRHIDLTDWPKEWPDYRDEQLVDLLRRAAPRKPSGGLSGDTPRRRYNDPQA